MRLSSRPATPVPPPRPRKRFSWGRVVYFLLLATGGYAGLRGGLSYLRYIQVPGVLSGENVKLESPVQARITGIDLRIGQPVTKGDRLAYLDTQDIDIQIVRQLNRLQELEANCRIEQQQLPLMIQEQQTQLALEQDKYNLRKLQVESELEQNQLQSREYERRAIQFEEQMGRAEKLKQYEAITQMEYQAVNRQLDEARDKLAQLQAGRKAMQDESAQIQKSLALLTKQAQEVNSQVQGKSKLLLYQAQLASANKELELLKQSLKQRVLTAPVTGVISAVYVKAGEIALSGEALASIATPQNLHLEAFFEAGQQEYLNPGQEVTVIFDNRRQGPGVIRRLHPVTDPIPPQFQPRFEPPKSALVAEIYPRTPQDWPDTCGLGAKVLIKRELF